MSIKTKLSATSRAVIRKGYDFFRVRYLASLVRALDESEARVTKAYADHEAETAAAQAALYRAQDRLRIAKEEGSKKAEAVNRTEGLVQDNISKEIARVNGEPNE